MAFSEVRAGDVTFLLHSEHQGSATVLRFGVPGRRVALACVTFVVPDDAAEPIYLRMVEYNPACATPALPEDRGSVLMTRMALNAVFDMHPRHRCVQFMDASNLNRCYAAASPRGGPPIQNGAPRLVVPLSYHNAMLYGRTWYQRHFGARPMRPPRYMRGRAEEPRDALRRLRASMAHPVTGRFDEWWDSYIAPGRPAFDPVFRWLHEEVRPIMEDLWLRGPSTRASTRGGNTTGGQQTWADYFQQVNQHCGCGVFSILINSWLRAPVSMGIGFNMDSWCWEIRRPDTHVEDTPGGTRGTAVTRGGGLRTHVRPARPALQRAGAAFLRELDAVREWEIAQGSRPTWAW